MTTLAPRKPLGRLLLLGGLLGLGPSFGCGDASQRSGSAALREDARPRKVKVDHPGLPLLAITQAELTRFKRGDALFEATVRESDGLGPLYVRDACSACHAGDGRGPGLVTKVVARSGDGRATAALLPFGPTEKPYVTAGAKVPLLSPAHPELVTTPRLPPAVFGRGYLEAVPDAELERLERAALARTGSIRGRLHRLSSGAIGRFGIKARLATLSDFTADALINDMGITSPTQASEPKGPEGLMDDRKPGVDFSEEQVALITEYVRLLDIPRRDPTSDRGRTLFDEAACSTCHVPSLRTDSAFPTKALAGVDAPIYTDLLLHDMGQSLADGLREDGASPREFRTAPLIGLRFLPSFLHDGRASTVEAAVLAHDGADSEARDSLALFKKMTRDDQRELLTFVEAL